MTLWIIFALMTAAAILAVPWPLARKPRAARAGSDLIVYQDQLQEIDRDRSAGLIGEAEAEAARIEVSRRLLAAADTQPPAPRAAGAAGVAPPRRGACGFDRSLARSGRPLCRARLAERSRGARTRPRQHRRRATNRSRTSISQVEAHLARNPDDGRRLGGDRSGLYAARPLR